MRKYLKIFTARLMVARAAQPFLYPEIDRKRHDLLTPNDAVEIAKEIDMGRGVTFIEEAAHPAHEINGPWIFSPEACKRHGVEG